MMENQKTDVVLKQELGLYRRLHGPEYPQLRVQVAFSNSCVQWSNIAHACWGVLGNVTGLRLLTLGAHARGLL